MLKNMKIGLRMGLGFAVLLAVMAALIGVSLHQITVSHDKLRRIVEINNVRLHLANDMSDDARETALAVKTIVLEKYRKQTNENIQKIFDDLAASRLCYKENIEDFKKLIPNEDTKGLDLFSKMEALGDTSRQLQDQVIELALTDKSDQGNDLIEKKADPTVKQWINGLNDLIRYNEEYNAMRYQQANEAQAAARTFMFSLGALALVLAAAIGIFLTQGIVRPLQGMAQIALKVGNGDLSSKTGYNSADEIGDLSSSFDLMIDKLKAAGENVVQRQQEMEEVQKEIRAAVNTLASSSNQIVALTAQLATSSTETATSISETTTTMEEVKQTSQQMSQRATAVSEAAQTTAQASEEGRRSVAETIIGMGRIREQMDLVADNIVRLSEQSQAIGQIISTVNDLATQSNLLAVNASIEAAKAGEEGKGFAVVAQEVRSLAEQSKEATNQVRVILGEIQKAVSGAVMATDQGAKVVEAGLMQSQQAGNSITRMAEDIVKAAQAALQISVGTNEQVVGIDQVSFAMENIKKATAQIVISTRQSEESAKNLHELGTKLKQLVEKTGGKDRG
ncbi:MAG: methyl-accepting chemotaxis protein, partial [Proteobacteria bacterium]|nr:methyl-accepting chemotaxis protein [Pseudomonadota bacterium]MBU1648719.1 methyl-accepting chemotaxis protein [Pseudomonadota bacterium]